MLVSKRFTKGADKKTTPKGPKRQRNIEGGSCQWSKMAFFECSKLHSKVSTLFFLLACRVLYCWIWWVLTHDIELAAILVIPSKPALRQVGVNHFWRFLTGTVTCVGTISTLILIVALGCITLEFVTICWCFQSTIFTKVYTQSWLVESQLKFCGENLSLLCWWSP